MRLIDADAVRKYIIETGFYCDTDADKEASAEILDTFPTVDAVEVVRCKDCKYGREITDANGLTLLSCNYQNAHGMLVENHGYCKWGKRKETEDG